MSIPQYRGRPIQILTIQPNEKFEVDLSENFKTVVKESLDTSEERRQCFPRPLYGLTYTSSTLSAVETAYIRKQLELSEADPFGVPFWPHRTMLLESAAAGATSLTVDSTVGLLFPVFDYVLIWSAFDTWEVVALDSAITSGTLELGEATTLDWSAGTAANPVFVMPLTCGDLKRPGSDPYTDEHVKIKFEFMETFDLHTNNTPETEPPRPPIIPTIEYSECRDEITISWTGLTLGTGDIYKDAPHPDWILNAEIKHSDSPDGPWLFWGETRQPVKKVVLSNYFKTRWVLVHAQSLNGNITVAKFKPLPPLVDLPVIRVQQFQRSTTDYEDVGVTNIPPLYEGGKTAAPYGQYESIYSHLAYSAIDAGVHPRAPEPGQDWPLGYGGYKTTENSGLALGTLARDQVSAIFPGLLENAAGEKVVKLPMFSEAFIELAWRYGPELFDVTGATGKLLRILSSTSQAGATVKFTFDGTDPTMTNGLDTEAVLDPAQINGPVPFFPCIIARAFKGDCKSPPLYVPIDVVIDQTASVTAIGRGGDGVASHLCGVFYHDADGNLVTVSGGGDGSNWPCTDVDLGALRIASLATACGGSVVNNHGHVLRDNNPDGTPEFLTRPAFDFPEGPDPGITGIWFGGGRWVSNASMWKTIDFSYSWDASVFTHKPVDPFYLLDGAITSSGLPIAFPDGGGGRANVKGLAGASGGSANNMAEMMWKNIPGTVKACPSEGAHDVLTGVKVTICCISA